MESQAVFQAKTQAKMFSIELPPRAATLAASWPTEVCRGWVATAPSRCGLTWWGPTRGSESSSPCFPSSESCSTLSHHRTADHLWSIVCLQMAIQIHRPFRYVTLPLTNMNSGFKNGFFYKQGRWRPSFRFYKFEFKRSKHLYIEVLTGLVT